MHSSTRLALGLSVLGLAFASSTVVKVTDAAEIETGLCSAAGATPVLDGSGPTPPALQSGRELPAGRVVDAEWREIARPPFAGPYEAAVWTGDEVLIVKRDSGRTATYDPERGRWREGTRPDPDLSELAGWAAWTDDELVVLDDTSSEELMSLGGAAYSPMLDRWRSIATLPIEGEVPRRVAYAGWTGEELLVITTDLHALVYYPEDDCWAILPDVPAEPGAWGDRLYWDGHALLAETRSDDAGVAVVAFDSGTLTWGRPSRGPADPMAAIGGGVWVDGQLWFVTWHPGGLTGLLNASIDPATLEWTEFEHDCPQAHTQRFRRRGCSSMAVRASRWTRAPAGATASRPATRS